MFFGEVSTVERIIIHSDMNSCYASIECSLNPELNGKPVAVGGRKEDRHGIILAKNEEAKKYGVKTGEVIWQAQRKCPELVIVPPHFDIYMKYSRLASQIYSDYSDRIEPMGLDEVWCDLTGYAKTYEEAKAIADEIRSRFKDELGITVSIGISFNKIFAKLCSDLAGRDEVYTVTPDSFKEKLWKLPVSSMLGIGRKTAVQLKNYCINTIGDLAASDSEWLRSVFGVCGIDMYRNANGLDMSPVAKYGEYPEVKSVGHGVTCKEDLTDNDQVWRVFLSLSQLVAKKLKSEKMIASGVQISVRDNQLVTRQFQCEMSISTRSAFEIATAAFSLFEKQYTWRNNVRALSVRAINLEDEDTPLQLDLYNDYRKHDRQMKIEDTVLDLRRRFGENAIKNCCLMLEDKIPGESDNKPTPFMRDFRKGEKK